MRKLFMINSDMIGKVISFTTHSSPILGDNFKRCKVLGLLDADSAKYSTDVERLAISVYPSLPSSTPKDYRKYIYVKVQLTNGEVTCIANQWINQDSVVVHDDVSVQLTISKINAEDIDRIINILHAHNYKNITSKQL